MYIFDEDLIDRALRHYTLLHCGEYDEEFYCETWYRCYGNRALEICITLDYIDALCEPWCVSDKADKQSLSESFNQHEKPLANRNSMAGGRIKGKPL